MHNYLPVLAAAVRVLGALTSAGAARLDAAGSLPLLHVPESESEQSVT